MTDTRHLSAEKAAREGTAPETETDAAGQRLITWQAVMVRQQAIPARIVPAKAVSETGISAWAQGRADGGAPMQCTVTSAKAAPGKSACAVRRRARSRPIKLW
ncbi:MAG: hypothetical protein M3Y28_04730 [Armatimonadota bacterium]|nr:hypothetical protein [Armatimonadota bacterium]